MTTQSWYVQVVYADKAWRDRVAVALDGRPVRCMTVGRWLARPPDCRPAPHAMILQAESDSKAVGPETIPRLRARNPLSRLVVIGPVSGQGGLEALRQAGADDVFAEPADAATLAKRVQQSLLDFDGSPTRAMRRDAIITEAIESAEEGETLRPEHPDDDHPARLDADDFDPGDNTRRLRDIRARLRQAYLDSTGALVAAAEAKEKFARRHSVNVSNIAEGIARRMGLPESLIERVKTAAILHDVGKIGIPDSILTKPSRLTEEEFEVIKRHPRIAMDILGHVSFLEAELPMILHHHERHDGTGYPEGLAGADIPLGARIIAVADAVEVMFARRSYKTPYDVGRVRAELRRQAGRQFDPTIAAAAIEWMAEPQAARIVRAGLSSARSATAGWVDAAKPAWADQSASFRSTV